MRRELVVGRCKLKVVEVWAFTERDQSAVEARHTAEFLLDLY